MVTCPRCQQPVDETVRTSCPLCFTPIPQATHASGPLAGMPADGVQVQGGPPQGLQAPMQNPAMPYPQPEMQQPPMQAAPMPMPAASRPLLNPGARISLTGEVIEAGGSASPPPSYVGGAGPTAPRGPQPTSSARAKSPMMRPQEAAPEKSGSGAVGLVVALLLLIGGGVGGYFWLMNRTNPKDQALAVYKAVLGQDYKAAYALTALSPEAQKKTPDADAFAQDAGKLTDAFGPLKDTIMANLKSAASAATVGPATITGDKAEVPTHCTITLPKMGLFPGGEYKLKGTAHMKNDFGIWKLDRTAEGEGAGSQTLKDLVGTPET